MYGSQCSKIVRFREIHQFNWNLLRSWVQISKLVAGKGTVESIWAQSENYYVHYLLYQQKKQFSFSFSNIFIRH